MFSALLLSTLIVPPGGVEIIDPARLEGHGQQAALASVQWREENGSRIVRVEVGRATSNTWEVELGTGMTQPMARGDVGLASFWARCLQGQPETGEGEAAFVVQDGPPNWSKTIVQKLSIPKDWKRYDIRFKALGDLKPGEGNVQFQLGFRRQILEFKDVRVVNYRDTVRMEDLPKMEVRYKGDDPNATWRAEAQKRIDQIRKGDLVVTVLDAAGKPVRDAQVQVEQTRHAFRFGTAVNAELLMSEGPDADRYRQVLKDNFNAATIENHLKWPFYEEWGKEKGLQALDWLVKNDFPVRAHCVIWPGYGNLPGDLPNLAGDPVALRARIEGRIQDITSATKGKPTWWDVVNEAYANHDLMNILGWEEVGKWFHRVKELDPKPQLTLNDYPPLDGEATQNEHLNQFFALADRLKKEGAPIESIGFQCHFGGDIVPPERVLSGLDRFAKIGLPIHITEFDMNTQDEDLQERYMRDFLYAAFSHPSVESIIQWGFWENSHWLPASALWQADWSLRPHGKVFQELTQKTWRTDLQGKTDAKGQLRVRGFYGAYRLSLKGQSFDYELVAGKPGQVTLRLK